MKLEDILKFKRDERFNHKLVKTNTNPDEEVKNDNSVELAFGQAIMPFERSGWIWTSYNVIRELEMHLDNLW